MNINRTYSSPKFYKNRNGYTPDMVVLHHTAGNVLMPAINWHIYPKEGPSSNFMMDLDGTVYELVPIQHGAWCNGTSNSPTDKLYYGKATSEIVKSRNYNANYYTVSIEVVGTGGAYTKAQVAALIELIKYIKSEIKRLYGKDLVVDRQHIIGHYEVSPITKPICGKNVQYDEIIAGVNGVAVTPTVSTTPTASKIYRVQVGAFGVKANADKYAAELKGKGYSVITALDGKIYRVQVGAFSVRANADKLAKELQGKGYKTIIKEA